MTQRIEQTVGDGVASLNFAGNGDGYQPQFTTDSVRRLHAWPLHTCLLSQRPSIAGVADAQASFDAVLRFHSRSSRCVRVSPGSEIKCCKSSGLSTSTAMPGRCNTTQGLPVA